MRQIQVMYTEEKKTFTEIFNTNLESHPRHITERTTALGAPSPVSLSRINNALGLNTRGGLAFNANTPPDTMECGAYYLLTKNGPVHASTNFTINRLMSALAAISKLKGVAAWAVSLANGKEYHQEAEMRLKMPALNPKEQA